MKAKIIKSLNSNLWDSFVDTSDNGTIFHKLKFLKYHQNSKFNFSNIEFYSNGQLVGVIPGTIKNKVFTSPSGASYGSIVTKKLDFNDQEKIVDIFLNTLKKLGVQKVYLTPPPIFYKNTLSQQDDFLLYYKGFLPSRSLITHALSLSDIDKNQALYSLKKRARTSIRASLKTKLIVRDSKKLDEFYPILLENKEKFSAKPTHTIEELKLIQKLFPDDFKLFMAYQDNNPIAGVVTFVCNKQVVLFFYIAQKYSFHHLNPVPRLIYEVTLWANMQKYKWLDFGVSMDTLSNDPMEPSRNLIFFKESFATQAFLRTTYYKKL